MPNLPTNTASEAIDMLSAKPGTRTWDDGKRCAECCTHMRCDANCTDRDRENCPHCLGTGWALWTAAGMHDYLVNYRKMPIPTAAAPGEEAFRHALQLIADFPIREQDGMPSANMRAVAVAALAGAIHKPAAPRLAGEEAVAEIVRYPQHNDDEFDLRWIKATELAIGTKLYPHPVFPRVDAQMVERALAAWDRLEDMATVEFGEGAFNLYRLQAMRSALEAAINLSVPSTPSLAGQTHSAPGGDELVERVARALCISRGVNPDALHADPHSEGPFDVEFSAHDGPLKGGFYGWRKQEKHARAVLAAIAKDSAT